VEVLTGQGDKSWKVRLRVERDARGNVIDIKIESQKEYKEKHKGTEIRIIKECYSDMEANIQALGTNFLLNKDVGGGVSDYLDLNGTR
jgi:hypothetical protein